MDDYLVRIITEEKNILGLACITTNLVNDARKRHGTFPTATAALGRALTGGELLGALLEPDQRVALKFTGNGPLGSPRRWSIAMNVYKAYQTLSTFYAATTTMMEMDLNFYAMTEAAESGASGDGRGPTLPPCSPSPGQGCSWS